MANDAGTNGRRGTTEHISEATRGVAKRQKRVVGDQFLRIRAKRSPSRIRRNRGEITHKLVNIRRRVRKRVSRSRGRRHGREGEIQKRLSILRKLVEGRMKTGVATEGTEAGIRRTPTANDAGNVRAETLRRLPDTRRGEADKGLPVVRQIRRRRPRRRRRGRRIAVFLNDRDIIDILDAVVVIVVVVFADAGRSVINSSRSSSGRREERRDPRPS